MDMEEIGDEEGAAVQDNLFFFMSSKLYIVQLSLGSFLHKMIQKRRDNPFIRVTNQPKPKPTLLHFVYYFEKYLF